MSSRSSSIICSSTIGFEDLDFQNTNRQKIWELTKQISALTIKLESEKMRNSHLEENYLKLPATLESLQETKADLEVSKSFISQLEQRLKESQSTSSKYRKDLEDFREYAFREIKDKELALISQSSSMRTMQNEQDTIRNQCQKLLEEYELKVKRLKTFKQKYRQAKNELQELKASAASSKVNSEFLNLKLELEVTQRKMNDFKRSRDELGKRCTDLEDKIQYLNSQKSDLKAAAHRRDRTMVDLEKDFKFTLEGIKSEKSEEVQELIDKVALLEKQIRELKKNHEDILNEKEEEKLRERDKVDEAKKNLEKVNKDKQRSDLELAACKDLLDEANNKNIELKIEFEEQLEFIKKNNKEKIIDLKREINELKQTNKELLETIEINGRMSVIQGGETLADELGQLEYRDSRIFNSFVRDSIFKQHSETDKNLEKLKKLKEKKKKIKQELISKSEQLIENSRILTQNEKTIRNLNSDISCFKDMINDLNSSIKKLESEKESNKFEVSRLNSLNSDLNTSIRELKDKNFSIETEMTKQTNDLEERILNLKKKYGDKILKYKEDILDLTQRSAQLRNNLSTTKTLTQTQASELEGSKKLLNKNNKLKEKVAGMEKALKTSTDTINKLQGKLSELYKIPNIEDEIEPNEKIISIDERIGSDSDQVDGEVQKLKEKLNDLQITNDELNSRLVQEKDAVESKFKLKIEELQLQVNDLTKLLRTEKEVLVINKPSLSEYSTSLSASSSKATLSINQTQAIETFTKKVQKLAKDLNFSMQTVNSSILFDSNPTLSPSKASLSQDSSQFSLAGKAKNKNPKDSIELQSDDRDQQNPVPKSVLSETSQVYLFSLSPKDSNQEDLEMQVFRLQQDLNIKTERFQKIQNDYEERLDSYEEKIRALEDERQQYTYVTNTEMDECTDSEEENSIRHSEKIAAVSIIDDYEPVTEGSVLETENDDELRNPFDFIKESVLMKDAECDNQKIFKLESEIAEKANLVRQYHEKIKDLEAKLNSTENLNAQINHKVKELESKIKNEASSKTVESKEKSHDWVLQEAKMTLLQAHNQRLETELIVSKTNWGEMTNQLVKDINDMEKKLKDAENDYRSVCEEKEELVRRLNQPQKKKSGWGIFARKKRNSDIN